jgi:hypothetical protein
MAALTVELRVVWMVERRAALKVEMMVVLMV